MGYSILFILYDFLARILKPYNSHNCTLHHKLSSKKSLMPSFKNKIRLYCCLSAFSAFIPLFLTAQVNKTKTPGAPEICQLLTIKEEFPEKDSNLDLYDRLIGSWTLKGIWYNKDGTKNEGGGEWHFQKIIGGRGVLDVIYGKNAHAYNYGTTLRCYDKSIKAWRISFMQPASGEFVNLIGRKTDDMIVHEGSVIVPKPGLNRWTFKEITGDSFHWTGEFSEDDGVTWVLEQEMYGKRLLAVIEKN